MNFKNLSITIKLPMAFVLLTLFVVFSISYLGYRDFRGALLNQTESKLRILTHERGASIRSWFEGMSNLVQQYGTDPNVIKAIQGFSATFGLVMDDPVKELQEAYILNNPHPIGEKDSLDRAEKPIPYNYQHEAFHPFFRNIKNSLSLYDVFLFDLAGNLIYSVYKEADFATNFETGIYSKSGLGIAFRAAKNDPSGGVHFVDFKPYAPSAGDPASFMATAIQDTSGNVMGVFAIQLPADQLTAVVNEPSGLEATGELTLIAEDQKARSDSRFEGRHNVFKILDFSPDINAALGEREGFFPYQIGLSGKPSVSLLHGVEVLGHKWVLLGEFETAEVYDAAVAQRNKTVLFSSIAIAGMAVIAWLLSRSFTNPLIAVINSMAKIGNREYDIDLSSNLRGDEIGDLSRALGTMSDRSQEYDRKVEEEKQHVQAQEFAVSELGIALKKLANNDLSHYLHTPFAPEYEALRQDFNDTVMNLKATVRQLIEFSTMIENQTTIMSKESSDLSTRTENQAATLEETAAAVHQITGKVKSSALELKSAEKLTLEASSKATKGQTVVESTSNAMSEIEQVSKEIHDIIGVVDDIAFQTNLLALNAGVEAARAGEAGQGFAVVALEVGQLANRTTDSVGTIKSLIENSGRAVHNGVELVSGTEAALTEIVNHIASISDLITSVAGTSGQQSDSLAEVNIGVSQLDQATQKNVEMVDQSNATARELKDEAVKLVNILSGFDLGTQPIEAPDLVAKQTALRSSSGLKRIA